MIVLVDAASWRASNKAVIVSAGRLTFGQNTFELKSGNAYFLDCEKGLITKTSPVDAQLKLNEADIDAFLHKLFPD